MPFDSVTGPRYGKLGGRPKGWVSGGEKAWRQRVAALHRNGETPGDVMIDNMLFWYKRTDLIKRTLARFLSDDKKLSLEERKRVLELLERYTVARDKSQECAKDAAPYVHPKLQSVTITPDELPDIEGLSALTDDKLAEIVARGMSAALEKRDAGMVDVTPVKGRITARK
jgi:hypothetical protein